MVPPTFSFHIFVVKLVLLLAAVFPVYSSDPHSNIRLHLINPPPSQCQPFTFHWAGGAPPFFVFLRQDGVLQRSLGPTNGWSFSWDSDFPAGTVLTATVSGSGGSSSEETGAFTVQAGPSSDCLGPSPIASPSESNFAVYSTDRTLPHTPSSSLSPSARSTSVELTPPSGPKAATTALPSTDPQDPSVDYSYISTPFIVSHSDAPSTSAASASAVPQQSAPPRASKGGRLAGIVIGCLLAVALLAALALVSLRKRRRARERSRIASMTILDTLAFTATTWSDLSPPDPDKPFGTNKGVMEWNADLFVRERRVSPDSRKRRSTSGRAPSTIPLQLPLAPSKRASAARVAPLSTIPEASAETSVPSPVESDNSASTAPSLHSYPPLVPLTLSLSAGDSPLRRQHAYPPAILLPAQVPVNPFRARLLAAAAASNGTWARGDDSEDPFK